MHIGMATKKITVTLDEDAVAQIKQLVERGDSPSVSAFVQRAVQSQFDADAIWDATLDQLLEETGGPITDEERAEIDRLWPKS